MEQAGGALLGDFATAVIAGRGLDGGMAGQLGDRDDVRPGVQQVADEGAAQVVGADGFDHSAGCPLAQEVVDSLARPPARPGSALPYSCYDALR